LIATAVAPTLIATAVDIGAASEHSVEGVAVPLVEDGHRAIGPTVDGEDAAAGRATAAHPADPPQAQAVAGGTTWDSDGESMDQVSLISGNIPALYTLAAPAQPEDGADVAVPRGPSDGRSKASPGQPSRKAKQRGAPAPGSGFAAEVRHGVELCRALSTSEMPTWALPSAQDASSVADEPSSPALERYDAPDAEIAPVLSAGRKRRAKGSTLSPL